MKLWTSLAVESAMHRMEGTMLVFSPSTSSLVRMTSMRLSILPVLIAIERLSQKFLMVPLFVSNPWIRIFVLLTLPLLDCRLLTMAAFSNTRTKQWRRILLLCANRSTCFQNRTPPVVVFHSRRVRRICSWARSRGLAMMAAGTSIDHGNSPVGDGRCPVGGGAASCAGGGAASCAGGGAASCAGGGAASCAGGGAA